MYRISDLWNGKSFALTQRHKIQRQHCNLLLFVNIVIHPFTKRIITNLHNPYSFHDLADRGKHACQYHLFGKPFSLTAYCIIAIHNAKIRTTHRSAYLLLKSNYTTVSSLLARCHLPQQCGLVRSTSNDKALLSQRPFLLHHPRKRNSLPPATEKVGKVGDTPRDSKFTMSRQTGTPRP